MEQTMMKEQPLDELVAAFLTDLAHANGTPHTHQAYATDLAQLCALTAASVCRPCASGWGISTCKGPCATPSSRMERLVQRYRLGYGSIHPSGEEDPQETPTALPVGSRKNRAHGTCHWAEEV